MIFFPIIYDSPVPVAVVENNKLKGIIVRGSVIGSPSRGKRGESIMQNIIRFYTRNYRLKNGSRNQVDDRDICIYFRSDQRTF